MQLVEATLSEDQIVEQMRKRAAEQLHSLEADLSVCLSVTCWIVSVCLFVTYLVLTTHAQTHGLDTGTSDLPLLVNLHRDHTIDGTIRYAIQRTSTISVCLYVCAC